MLLASGLDRYRHSLVHSGSRPSRRPFCFNTGWFYPLEMLTKLVRGCEKGYRCGEVLIKALAGHTGSSDRS
ncbi:hypothetical protein CONLIGDRAFT_65063 [Coniochaeta ligniaria NRRL 30616]|uniref:Uncharacterized protein n=1 Tax=Coniochaeta ligniaria NRRL 30616 TaxID=1408157 RepID=A0A1J7J836_9PEZI|nr:hypothetical protein CONLIGDRAFT_65063 [Coniochaeta ligniaria NRRL 30616]